MRTRSSFRVVNPERSTPNCYPTDQPQPGFHMPSIDRSSAKKLKQLGKLINDPIVKPRLPDGYYDGITEHLRQINEDGADSLPKELVESMIGLVDTYESWIVKYANEPPIYTSAKTGNTADVLQGLRSGFNINASDADGLTLLMLAASNGHADLVASLIEQRADVAATCAEQNDFDAMMMACAAGHAEVARLLVGQGVDVNKRYAPGSSRGRVGNQTALSFAANRGHVDVCRLLVSQGADMEIVADSGYTALMWALMSSSSEAAAELLIDSGANPAPNSRPIEAYAGALSTPLTMAARNGLTRMVTRLIEAGANLDGIDASGWTALKHASQAGHDEIVQALIEAGADLNLPDNEGWTPLIGAASRAAWSTVDLLIDAGADVNHVTESGATALREVVSRRLLRHMRVVLGRLTGNELDSELEESYESALIYVEKLLEAGADPDVTYEDDSEKMLIDEVKAGSDQQLFELLERFGAKPSEGSEDDANERDDDSDHGEPTDLAGLLSRLQGSLSNATNLLSGLSGSADEKPLGDQMIIAASHFNIDKVTELLESGVDVDHLDGDGDTALSICVLKLCTEELEPQQMRDIFELIGLLLTYDANVDVDGCRIAPLPMVARSGSLNLVNAFLRAGADPDAVLTDLDADAGKTALEVAQESGHEDIVAALLEAQQQG
jgi:ankyrin repeat protein